ncbi:hypothetical protein V9T40_004196 [Parthenolecanium corni]|uniref:Cation/H+ exchanger transmembrane domain-containing protein n=1 Tax=Parthenolecanium corni TaxID=536013 RepID=A0AAN9U354_9HEMI
MANITAQGEDTNHRKDAEVEYFSQNSTAQLQESLLDNKSKVEVTPAGSNFSPNNACKLRSASYIEKRLRRREKLSQPFGAENAIWIRLLSSFLCLFVVWGILFSLMRQEVVPGGRLLTLIALFASAYVVGDLFKLIGLPSLLGMLVTGIVMRNTGLYFDPKESGVYSNVVSTARQIALTCILITAGLELDPKSLRKLSIIVLELSFIPCIIEAIGVAVFCKLILDFPWMWGMLIGFVMGAVSPAIVVPSLLKLQKKGYDSDNKISTIVIAAASFDDIVAISGYGIFFGMIFNEGNIWLKIFHGPIEVLIGLLVGVLWGILAAWLPHPMDKHVVAKRVFMIGGGGLFLVLASPLIGYDGMGPLACIVSAFVACISWKWQGWSPSYNPVRDIFDSLWILLQPALFGLIGAEIDLLVLRVDDVTNSLLVIGGGLVARTIACSAVLMTADVTYKELLFINVSWLPKATVQAALGSLALDRVKYAEQPDLLTLHYAEVTLMIAVLSILVTAPIGAIGINVFGRILLEKDKPSAVTSSSA